MAHKQKHINNTEWHVAGIIGVGMCAHMLKVCVCECACNAFRIASLQWPCWQKVLHLNKYERKKQQLQKQQHQQQQRQPIWSLRKFGG